ncbi:MAG: GntR family transcriptional regulator [Rivihabitans pingtungensis]
MTTDKPSFQPLYQQIRTLLAQRIAQGEWAAHEALPSEWALAESLGVSQGTVRKALTDLVDEGWLYRQQGKGTFVAPGLNEWGDGHLVTPGQFAEPPGSPVPELLSCTRANASEDIAQALSLRRAAPLFRVRLLWRLAGVAVALDDAYVPVGRFEEIDARRLRQYGNSLYTLLERRDGVRVRLGAIQARATLPDRETMTLLGLSDVEPLLMITRLGQALTGEVVEWRERLCRSARWAFQRTVIQHSMGWSRPPGRPRETGRKTANHRTGFTRSQSARQVWADRS